MGRLKQITFSDESTQYIYDLAGRVIHMDDTSGSDSSFIGFAYNDTGFGRSDGNKISQELTPLGQVDYTYYDDGRRKSMTVAGEPTVNYGYDDAGRMTGISRNINGTVRTYNLGYDNAGRRSSLQLPLSTANQYVTTNYGFDTANHTDRLMSMLIEGPSAQIESLAYGYDPNYNRTSFTRTGWQSRKLCPLLCPLPPETVDFPETMDVMDNVETAYFTTI